MKKNVVKKILHFFELSRFRNIPGKTLLLKIIRRVYSIWEMGNQCECVCVRERGWCVCERESVACSVCVLDYVP